MDDLLGDIISLESVEAVMADNELNFIEPSLLSQTVSKTFYICTFNPTHSYRSGCGEMTLLKTYSKIFIF